MLYLTKQNLEIPRLGFGTWQITGNDCVQSVSDALEIGYRHIDTAQAYKNEPEVGKAIADSSVAREDIFLATKLSRDHLTKDKVLQSAQKSMDDLQTDYLDLLYIHWPNFEEASMEETLMAMTKLVDDGKVKLLGVSNYTSDQVDEAKRIAPQLACNQVEYHPLIDQTPVIQALRRNGMFLTGYSPLARGEVFGNETLSRIADKYNKSESQIVIRWAMQHEDIVVIPKASSREHAEDNFDVFDFEIAEEDMSDIEGLKVDHRRMIDPDFAPDWDQPSA